MYHLSTISSVLKCVELKVRNIVQYKLRQKYLVSSGIGEGRCIAHTDGPFAMRKEKTNLKFNYRADRLQTLRKLYKGTKNAHTMCISDIFRL